MRALRIRVRPPRLRVVLDTNLFVAAYWRPDGASGRILAACEAHHLLLVYSPAIQLELQHILRRAHTSHAFQQRVITLLEDSLAVRPRREIRRVRDDPDDDKFLACALEGGAAFVVTSDAHLLRLREVEGVGILTPLSFVRQHLDAPEHPW